MAADRERQAADTRGGKKRRIQAQVDRTEDEQSSRRGKRIHSVGGTATPGRAKKRRVSGDDVLAPSKKRDRQRDLTSPRQSKMSKSRHSPCPDPPLSTSVAKSGSKKNKRMAFENLGVSPLRKKRKHRSQRDGSLEVAEPGSPSATDDGRRDKKNGPGAGAACSREHLSGSPKEKKGAGRACGSTDVGRQVLGDMAGRACGSTDVGKTSRRVNKRKQEGADSGEGKKKLKTELRAEKAAKRDRRESELEASRSSIQNTTVVKRKRLRRKIGEVSEREVIDGRGADRLARPPHTGERLADAPRLWWEVDPDKCNNNDNKSQKTENFCHIYTDLRHGIS